jgi:hypothetical protein
MPPPEKTPSSSHRCHHNHHVRYSADRSSHGEASATAKMTKDATTEKQKNHHHRIATITITTLAIRRHILLKVVTDPPDRNATAL